MKTIHKCSALLFCVFIAMVFFNSCGWDRSPEYEHPLYVTYTISVSESEFVGPDQLLVDILSWVKANQLFYDVEINYKTGEASEFAKTDAKAIKQYEEFAPKFKTYLDEVYKKLEKGDYGSDAVVSVLFQIYAKRVQGQDGNLKYEEIMFAYPNKH